jgi:putative ATPase
MLDGGTDPKYLIRRMLSMAWDDIGLADPGAVRIVHSAAEACERLGPEQGSLALAQAVIYLAVADKSNAGASAFGAAMAFARNTGSQPVPPHLRHPYQDLHTPAGEALFPEGLAGARWYRPVLRGLEQAIGRKIAELSGADL